MKGSVVAACFFVKAQGLFNLKNAVVVRLLVNSFTAFSVQFQ